MSSSSRRLYVVLGAGTLLGLHPAARADNWELSPRIETGGTYNDNYRLADTDADKVEAYGPYIDAQVTAGMYSPRSKLEIVPRVYSTDYPTDHPDQSTNGYLDVDGEYKTLRSDFTGVAQYSNESVIYSELLPATFPGVALGQVVGGESGLVSVRNREQLEHVLPQFTRDLTQRLHLDLQVEYDRATFNKSAIEQVGFDNYYAQAGLGFDVTPRSTISVNGVGSRFEPQLGGHDTNTYGGNVEWDLRRSQIMHFYARLGLNQTRAQTSIGTVTGNGVTGGIGVDLRYQITEVVVDVLRALEPSAAGAEVVSNEARLRVVRAFEPRFSGYVGARAIQLRGAASQRVLAIEGEEYFTSEAGLDYQITENYRIEAKYIFMWQRFAGTPLATSNAVGLAFIYQPLSRYEPLPEFTGIPEER